MVHACRVKWIAFSNVFYLMRDNKDEHGGISASLDQIGAGNDVLGQLDIGKVSNVIRDRDLKVRKKDDGLVWSWLARHFKIKS